MKRSKINLFQLFTEGPPKSTRTLRETNSSLHTFTIIKMSILSIGTTEMEFLPPPEAMILNCRNEAF
jgi:hypothetical protein